MSVTTGTRCRRSRDCAASGDGTVRPLDAGARISGKLCGLDRRGTGNNGNGTAGIDKVGSGAKVALGPQSTLPSCAAPSGAAYGMESAASAAAVITRASRGFLRNAPAVGLERGRCSLAGKRCCAEDRRRRTCPQRTPPTCGVRLAKRIRPLPRALAAPHSDPQCRLLEERFLSRRRPKVNAVRSACHGRYPTAPSPRLTEGTD